MGSRIQTANAYRNSALKSPPPHVFDHLEKGDVCCEALRSEQSGSTASGSGYVVPSPGEGSHMWPILPSRPLPALRVYRSFYRCVFPPVGHLLCPLFNAGACDV